MSMTEGALHPTSLDAIRLRVSKDASRNSRESRESRDSRVSAVDSFTRFGHESARVVTAC